MKKIRCSFYLVFFLCVMAGSFILNGTKLLLADPTLNSLAEAVILESDTLAITFISEDGTILGWSAGCEKLTGKSKEEMVGSRIESIMHPGQAEAHRHAFDRSEMHYGDVKIISCALGSQDLVITIRYDKVRGEGLYIVTFAESDIKIKEQVTVQ